MSASPFQIRVPDQKLERLKKKLALAEFPDDTPTGASWDWGPPVDEIRRLTNVWQSSYDWRKVEAHLNTISQYLIPIEIEGFGTYNVHHIHRKSSSSGAIPLLFLHGWPGSFLEVTKILDSLVNGTPGGPTFHVVAPSLIDFGFSSPSGKKEFQMNQHAEAYDKLMQKLGYGQYVIQGGDLGYLIARHIVKKYGTRCKAYHTNTSGPAQPDAERHPALYEKYISTPLNEDDRSRLARAAVFSQEGYGYYKQMSTKPLTIGYSLRDSPASLLAWMYEKLHDWSDAYPWTDEEILTWVSIYYFSTAGPEATSNIYYAMEHSSPPAFVASQSYVDVPIGIARFRNDLVVLPKLWNETLGPVVFTSEHEKGGHFAAWEQPDAIISDVRSMFGTSYFRSVFGDE